MGTESGEPQEEAALACECAGLCVYMCTVQGVSPSAQVQPGEVWLELRLCLGNAELLCWLNAEENKKQLWDEMLKTWCIHSSECCGHTDTSHSLTVLSQKVTRSEQGLERTTRVNQGVVYQTVQEPVTSRWT